MLHFHRFNIVKQLVESLHVVCKNQSLQQCLSVVIAHECVVLIFSYINTNNYMLI